MANRAGQNAAISTGSSSGLTPEAVEKNLEVIAAGSTPKLPTKLAKVMKKRSGQLSVALEYKRAGGDTEEINHVDFRRYSVKMRESKLDVLFGDSIWHAHFAHATCCSFLLQHVDRQNA